MYKEACFTKLCVSKKNCWLLKHEFNVINSTPIVTLWRKVSVFIEQLCSRNCLIALFKTQSRCKCIRSISVAVASLYDLNRYYVVLLPRSEKTNNVKDKPGKCFHSHIIIQFPQVSVIMELSSTVLMGFVNIYNQGCISLKLKDLDYQIYIVICLLCWSMNYFFLVLSSAEQGFSILITNKQSDS